MFFCSSAILKDFGGYQMRLGITNKDVGIKKERKKEVNPETGVGFQMELKSR